MVSGGAWHAEPRQGFAFMRVSVGEERVFLAAWGPPHGCRRGLPVDTDRPTDQTAYACNESHTCCNPTPMKGCPLRVFIPLCSPVIIVGPARCKRVYRTPKVHADLDGWGRTWPRKRRISLTLLKQGGTMWAPLWTLSWEGCRVWSAFLGFPGSQG